MRGCRTLLALIVASHAASASPALDGAHAAPAQDAAHAAPAQDCAHAALAAEQRWRLPAGLLLAIGTVESGQRDPSSGQTLPWPWTLNAAGEPYVVDTAAEAAAVVGFLRARGVASIDVGCFQVNLRAHPDAFASIAQAFDPAGNADYAARLLARLHGRDPAWDRAIARYHSPDPSEGRAYAARVMRAWAPAARPDRIGGDPHVILIDRAAAAIPVFAGRPAGAREW